MNDETIVFDVSEISTVANRLLSKYSDCKIWIFEGNMGSGKTTLIKSICSSLEIVDLVSSPTFSVVNEYVTEKKMVLYHFDFYRINFVTEALDLGVDEYFNSGCFCFVEWPDSVFSLLPPNKLHLKLEYISEFKRKLTLCC